MIRDERVYDMCSYFAKILSGLKKNKKLLVSPSPCGVPDWEDSATPPSAANT